MEENERNGIALYNYVLKLGDFVCVCICERSVQIYAWNIVLVAGVRYEANNKQG